MTASTVLFIAGTLCGLYHTYLGICVGGHLLDPAKRKSPEERFVLAGVAWSVGTGDEFSGEGRQICRRGNLVLVAGILIWFAWGVTK